MTAQLPPGTAYVGIGLSQLGGMKGADIWLFNNSMDGSGWFLTDAYAAGFVAPVADFHQDITLLGIQSSSNGTLTAAWSRFLEPCDLQDLPITIDVPLRVIWAYQEAWGYHGSTTRGTKIVNFLPAANSSSGVEGGFDTSTTAQPEDADLKIMDLAYNVTIPAEETSYWIYYFKLPSDKKYHVVKYEVIGHRPQLHHGTAYTCTPQGNVMVENMTSLGPYNRLESITYCEQFYMIITPNLTYSMPPDAGLPIGTNNTKWVAIELHYNNPELVPGIHDRAGIRIYYTDKLRRHDVGVLTVSQPDLLLPPGRSSFPVNGGGEREEEGARRGLLVGRWLSIGWWQSAVDPRRDCRFKQPVTLLDTLLHQHSTGKAVKVRHYRSGRELTPIAQLRAFDYAYQNHFPIPVESRTLLPGDTVTLQCIFDTSQRKNLTHAGIATKDEMCFSWLTYYPAQDDMV
eukprot:gene11249-11398_t